MKVSTIGLVHAVVSQKRLKNLTVRHLINDVILARVLSKKLGVTTPDCSRKTSRSPRDGEPKADTLVLARKSVTRDFPSFRKVLQPADSRSDSPRDGQERRLRLIIPAGYTVSTPLSQRRQRASGGRVELFETFSDSWRLRLPTGGADGRI